MTSRPSRVSLAILLGVGCLCAGLYGMVHNQVSYTVSPEYFHAFKFRQFGVPPSLQNRLGAAWVGWWASWWMGLILGIPVLWIARGSRDSKGFTRRSLIAYAIVASTSAGIGLTMLVMVQFVVRDPDLVRTYVPEDVRHPLAFFWAGTMHNAGYLGGVLGMIGAAIFLRTAICRDSTVLSKG